MPDQTILSYLGNEKGQTLRAILTLLRGLRNAALKPLRRGGGRMTRKRNLFFGSPLTGIRHFLIEEQRKREG
jgi:hypothetical protein